MLLMVSSLRRAWATLREAKTVVRHEEADADGEWTPEWDDPMTIRGLMPLHYTTVPLLTPQPYSHKQGDQQQLTKVLA